MILDFDIWQSRIWRFHTGVETAGFIFLLGGQLRLLSLRSPKQPFLLGGQCVRFAYLSRFVSSRLSDASLRQYFSLGGQLRLLVLGPTVSGRWRLSILTFLSRTF